VFPGSSVVEQPAVNRLVAGSNPARGAKPNQTFNAKKLAVIGGLFCWFGYIAGNIPQILRNAESRNAESNGQSVCEGRNENRCSMLPERILCAREMNMPRRMSTDEWSGAGATKEPHKTISEYHQQSSRQTQKLINLTRAIAGLMIARWPPGYMTEIIF
jgi:hypothetical protein